MSKLEKVEQFPQPNPAAPRPQRTAAAARAPRCLHVRSNGTRCGSPALTQRDLCYFHHSVRDRYRGLPLIEDATSIQVGVMRVLQIINTGACNYKEVGLMLYGLQIAAQNLRSCRDEQALAADIVRYDPEDRDQLREYQAALASGELVLEAGDAASGNPLPSAETVAAAEELSAADLASAIAGAPTEEQREMAIAREEMRLRRAQQREESKR